jgi:hypothetical protein
MIVAGLIHAVVRWQAASDVAGRGDLRQRTKHGRATGAFRLARDAGGGVRQTSERDRRDGVPVPESFWSFLGDEADRANVGLTAR